MIECVGNDEIQKVFESNDVYFLLYFTAKWCKPCQSIYPSLLKLEEGIKEKVLFIKIDIDKNEEFVEKNNISSVPTFLIYKDDIVKDRISGSNIKNIGNMLIKNVKV